MLGVFASFLAALGLVGSSGAVVGSGGATAPGWTSFPGDIVAEATSGAGAVVSYALPTATYVGKPMTVSCAPGSGATFPLGSGTVNCTATLSEITAARSFMVTVKDTTPPTLSVPTDISVQAAGGASSATVSFAVSATDLVDGTDPVSCDHVSGSSFAAGTTTVMCSAHDKAGNGASKSFVVVVKPGTVTTVGGGDTPPPTTTTTTSTTPTTTIAATTTTPRGPSPRPRR